jgi:hypothetical protein
LGLAGDSKGLVRYFTADELSEYFTWMRRKKVTRKVSSINQEISRLLKIAERRELQFQEDMK